MEAIVGIEHDARRGRAVEGQQPWLIPKHFGLAVARVGTRVVGEWRVFVVQQTPFVNAEDVPRGPAPMHAERPSVAQRVLGIFVGSRIHVGVPLGGNAKAHAKPLDCAVAVRRNNEPYHGILCRKVHPCNGSLFDANPPLFGIQQFELAQVAFQAFQLNRPSFNVRGVAPDLERFVVPFQPQPQFDGGGGKRCWDVALLARDEGQHKAEGRQEQGQFHLHKGTKRAWHGW